MTTEVSQYRIEGDGSASIATSIERGIEVGALGPGTELPSVRALARELGVSPTTVSAAYRDLKARGLVVAHDRSRTVVSHRPPLEVRPSVTVPDGVVDVASGNPDPALLPSLEAAARSLTLPPRLYDEEAVIDEVRDLARTWFAGWGLSDDDLVVVSGALDGVERVLAAHLRPGDRVGLEDPGYTAVIDLCRAMGLVPVPLALDDEGPTPDGLEAALRADVAAVIVTPRAQNPTGAAITPARAEALREALTAAPRVLVVEDDHAGEVAGTPAVTLTAGRERWATIRSVAKSLGPDLRVALAVGDATTVARVAGRQRLGCGWVSHVLQRLTVALWHEAVREDLFTRAATTYAARRRALVAALERHGIVATGASGLNVWIPVTSESATVPSLLTRGWAVRAGEHYRLASPPGIRVTTAALDTGAVERFAADLVDVLQPTTRTRRG